MNGVQVAGIGNLTRDPELRFTQSGIAWVTFTVAVNKFRGSGDNRTEVTTFLNCKAWREMAENISETLHKGDRVYVEGTLEIEEWGEEGNKRTSPTLVVDDCGPSLRWATAQVTRRGRDGGSSQSRSAPVPAAAAASSGGYGGGGGYGSGGASDPDAGHDPFGIDEDGENPF